MGAVPKGYVGLQNAEFESMLAYCIHSSQNMQKKEIV